MLYGSSIVVTLYSKYGSEHGFSRTVFPTVWGRCGGGGLPKSQDGTRLPLGVRLGQRNLRTAIFGSNGGSYRVRQHFSGGRDRTAGDAEGRGLDE